MLARLLSLFVIWLFTSAFFGPDRSSHPLGEVINFTSEPTRYELKHQKNESIIHAITGDESASGLVIANPEKCFINDQLNWRWKLQKSHSSVDVEQKEQEDFAASVHLIYSAHEGSDFYKHDFHMLSYIWVAQDKLIESILNAPTNRAGTQKRILLQNKATPLHEWKTQSRNIKHDIRLAFNELPPYPLRAMMLFTDSDQTAQTAEALYQMDCFKQ